MEIPWEDFYGIWLAVDRRYATEYFDHCYDQAERELDCSETSQHPRRPVAALTHEREPDKVIFYNPALLIRERFIEQLDG